MPTIGKIKAELFGDTRNFDHAMRRSGRQVDRLSQKFSAFRSAILPLTGALGFGSLVRSTLAEADNMAKLSRRLSVTVEDFSRLARVLDMAGVGMNQTAMMLQRLQRRAADARDGNDQLAAAFGELGINLEQFLMMSPVDNFLQLTDALQKVTEPAKRIQLAFKLLDSEGVAVLNANLPTLREEFDRMTPITTAQARSIEQLNDALKALGNTAKSIAAESFVTVKEGVPALFELIGRMTGLSKPLYERYPELLNAPEPPRRAGGGGGRQGLTNVRTPQLLPDNTFTGGDLGPSNAILQELRKIERNTQDTGAVLQ